MKNIFRNLIVVVLLAGMTGLVSCELFEDSINPIAPLTESEIIQGLKEALSIGLNTSVTSASQADGYLQDEVIKILLPDEVKELQSKIQTESIGIVPLSVIYDAYIAVENDGNDLFDELITAMNRGAENAADKALPIFGSAITNMSISDARGILDGDNTAATEYFYDETNVALFQAFNPDVKTALDGTGAIQIYSDVVGFLNFEYDAGLVTVSPNDVLNVTLPANIDEYATNKAIDGLFHLVGEEEKKIRDDPFSWGSDIIERVFGSN